MKIVVNHSIIRCLCMIALVLGSCKGSKDQQEPETNIQSNPLDTITFTQAQIDLAEIEIGTFEKRRLSKTVHCNGTIDLPPSRIATVTSVTGGTVKTIGDISAGKYVRKGDVLATIENPEFISFQRDYLESKSQFEYLSAEYKRQQELSAENAASQKTLQQVKSDYEGVKARLMAASAQLDMLGIDRDNIEQDGIRSVIPVRASINGYITEISVNLGKYVQAGEAMFGIADKSQMRLTLDLYEKDLSAVSVGNEVIFRTVANPKKENKARIEHIGEMIDQDKRSIRVTANILSDEPYFRTGMYVTAQIHSEVTEVQSLPQTAVVQDEEGGFSIFLKENRQFVRKEVQVGMVQEDYMEIANASDFSSDDLIVAKGAHYIETELAKRLE